MPLRSLYLFLSLSWVPVNVQKEDKFLHLLNILMEYKRYFIFIAISDWLLGDWVTADNSASFCLLFFITDAQKYLFNFVQP